MKLPKKKIKSKRVADEPQEPVSLLAAKERDTGGVKKIPKLGMKPGNNLGSDEMKLPIKPEFPSRG